MWAIATTAFLFSFSKMLLEIQLLYVCPVFVCVIPQVRLEWPTDLAVNPLDNSLYILDNNIVLQVDSPKHTQNTCLPVNEFLFKLMLFLRNICSINSQERESNISHNLQCCHLGCI